MAGAKIPPHSIEAEKSILGSMLTNENCTVSALSEMKSEDFYERRHREIFQAMSDLFNGGKAVDLVTVTDKMEQSGKMQSGVAEYLVELTDIVPSVANLKYYIEIVKEKSSMRKLIDVCTGVIDDAYENQKEPDDIIGRAGDGIYGIAMKNSKQAWMTLSEAMEECYARLSEAMDSVDGLMGIPTGFPTLDKKLSGLQGSQLIVVAGRPGMGKTSFALNIVEYVANVRKLPCLLFSMEMSADQLASRILSSDSQVDSQKMRSGNLSAQDTKNIAQSMRELREAPIFIDDSAVITVTEMLAKAHRLQKQHGLSLIVIDYLQLMSSGARVESRQQEISSITRTLKIMAKELNVPIILLSQLSRASEKRDKGNRRPMLSDLRESGAIEQDADVVIFLHREGYYMDAGEDVDDTKAEIIIAKQRSGPTDTVYARWNGNLTKYEEVDNYHSEPEY